MTFGDTPVSDLPGDLRSHSRSSLMIQLAAATSERRGAVTEAVVEVAKCSWKEKRQEVRRKATESEEKSKENRRKEIGIFFLTSCLFSLPRN